MCTFVGEVKDWQLLTSITSAKNHMNKCLTFAVGKEQLVFGSEQPSSCDNHLCFSPLLMNQNFNINLACANGLEPRGRSVQGGSVPKMKVSDVTTQGHRCHSIS